MSMLDKAPSFQEIDGTEPTLRSLVHKYYEEHFPLGLANNYAMRYLAQVDPPETYEQYIKRSGAMDSTSTRAWFDVHLSRGLTQVDTWQPRAGQPHEMDDAFYKLTVMQRDNAWRECEALRAIVAELRGK